MNIVVIGLWTLISYAAYPFGFVWMFVESGFILGADDARRMVDKHLAGGRK